jgi:hypothetical protein
MTLGRIQRGLERMYRVETGLEVDDFVIDGPTRDAICDGRTRSAREQLLLSEDGGELSIALFVDGAAIANLERRDPQDRLDDHNLGDFLLAVEGVSHFVYTVICAHRARPVSALELELQAEVDKYVTCVLVAGTDRDWRSRLFVEFELEPDLEADERDRYHAANQNAMRYARSLEQRFLSRRRVPAMLDELRRFYRLPLAGKLAHIEKAA